MGVSGKSPCFWLKGRNDQVSEVITDLFLNSALITAVIAMLLTQVIKIVYYFIIEKRLNWVHFFEAGGMPSSHSALVCSLTMMVGLCEGFDSILFAIAAVFSAIVMYDAMKVRAEEVGHTLIEVFTGGLLGLVIVLISYFNFFRG
jgi:acid phosphatase family membrane protein YuiD